MTGDAIIQFVNEHGFTGGDAALRRRIRQYAYKQCLEELQWLNDTSSDNEQLRTNTVRRIRELDRNIQEITE